MSTNIQEALHHQLGNFIAIREHLHSYPELSFEEFSTAEYISSKLLEFDIEHQTGIAGTGIVGLIKGKNPNKRIIALRADMDALPITEANDVPYKSKNIGVMHACGHDVHMTCLLGAAQLLSKTTDKWEGTIKLIFQPGEEKAPGGANIMIKEGVLENPKPQAIFALHVHPELEVGHVGFRSGQYMASCDEIKIIVKGKGGHAAMPHKTIDPIVIASQIILNLQTIISRRHNSVTSPSVLSFGKIAGGQAGNVIPDEVVLEGTLRCMDEEWRKEAQTLIRKQTKEIAQAMGGEAEVIMPEGYPSLFNDPDTVTRAEKIAIDYFGNQQVHTLEKRMTGEDFSFYTHEVPGCFMRLGTSLGNYYTIPVHNAHFDIHSDAIGVGIQLLYEIATKF